MHLGFPTQLSATKTQSSPPSSGPPSTTFELNCGYHLRIFYEDIKWESYDYIISTGLDIANPFPPDLSGYVHGFIY